MEELGDIDLLEILIQAILWSYGHQTTALLLAAIAIAVIYCLGWLVLKSLRDLGFIRPKAYANAREWMGIAALIFIVFILGVITS